jgi:hypothetical protein
MCMAIADDIRAALASGHSLDELRAVAKQDLDAGVPRDQIIEALEAIRPSLSDEDEDVVLEVLDFVTGWCSPSARL